MAWASGVPKSVSLPLGNRFPPFHASDSAVNAISRLSKPNHFISMEFCSRRCNFSRFAKNMFPIASQRVMGVDPFGNSIERVRSISTNSTAVCGRDTVVMQPGRTSISNINRIAADRSPHKTIRRRAFKLPNDGRMNNIAINIAAINSNQAG